VCKGDGENATEILFEKKVVDGKETTLKIGEKAVKCEGCPYAKEGRTNEGRKIPKRCSPLASLMVLLPKVPGIGVYQLDTGSYHSIVGVNAGIKLARAVYKRITGIPLRLILSPKTVKADGRAKVVYILSLSIEGTLEAALKNAAAAPQISDGAKALLPPPDEDHAGDISDEEQGEEIEDNEDNEAAPEEDLITEEIATGIDPKTHAIILNKQSQKLGYSPEFMSAYIERSYKKKSSKDMTSKEMENIINHMGQLIHLLELSNGVYIAEELQSNASKIYSKKELIDLTAVELEAFIKLIERSVPSGK